MKRKELIELLRALLIALAEQETPPPKPKAPPPPLGHTAYIKPDYAMCCPAHEEAFMPVPFQWIEWRGR